MKPTSILCLRTLLAVLLSSLVSSGLGAQAAKVLFLTHTAGDQFELVPSKDCSLITAKTLASYAAVVFYTSGELPISEQGRQDLLDFVRRGGGFVGIHSATDTFYKFPAYGEMLGAYFDGHPWNQKVRILVSEQNHPATALLGPSFEIREEVCQFTSFSPKKVDVLLRMDPKSVDIDKGRGKNQDYALAWCRDYGQGRVFYTALGKHPETWSNRAFLRHLVAGIRWTLQPAGTLSRPPRKALVLYDGRDLDSWQQAGDTGPLLLQDHGHKVSFRNIWLLPR